MLIGEVAKHTGFTADTIRWYEKIGLIKMDSKSRNRNNYRNYSEQVLKRLLLIRQIKSFGFSLNEVEDLLALLDIDDLNCKSVSYVIDPKITLITQKIEELQTIKSKLIEAKEKCSGKCIELFEEKKG